VECRDVPWLFSSGGDRLVFSLQSSILTDMQDIPTTGGVETGEQIHTRTENREPMTR